MGASMGQILKKFWSQLDEGITKDVFDNLRNFLMCALLFAAGNDALYGDSRLLLGLFVSHVAGWGLICLAAILMLLNICDGLKKLSKLRYHVALQVLVCLFYIIFAERVVELVWNFRSP
jgi:amino acid permease